MIAADEKAKKQTAPKAQQEGTARSRQVRRARERGEGAEQRVTERGEYPKAEPKL